MLPAQFFYTLIIIAETIFNIQQVVIGNIYLQAIKLMKRQIRILIERLSCTRMPTKLRILILALTYQQAYLNYVPCSRIQTNHIIAFVFQLLGFMYGWLTFYHHGHEVAKDYKPHMTELQTRIQKVLFYQ